MTQLYLKSFFNWKLILSVLEAFGALWILVSILDYFSQLPEFSSWLKTQWMLFCTFGILIGAYRSWPRLSYCYPLKNRDIQIEIKIKDLFRQKGAWVISTNTTFDIELSPDLISPESLQGQFTSRFYSNWRALDNVVTGQLETITPLENLSGDRRGKSKRYRFGETIHVSPSKDHSAYLVAISDLNEHGNASGSLDNLRQALAGLWDFVRTRGSHGNLSIPILGTGPTRLPQTREEIAIEIIRSFIAASAESTFCPKLTVVIHPSDVSEYGMDLQNLDNFLSLACKFNGVVSSETGNEALGQGIQ